MYICTRLIDKTRHMQFPIPLHRISSEGEKFFFDFLEWQRKDNNYDSSFPHRHQYYEVIFIDEGEGVHEIDFISYPIKAPSLHFVPIGKIHQLNMTYPLFGM